MPIVGFSQRFAACPEVRIRFVEATAQDHQLADQVLGLGSLQYELSDDDLTPLGVRGHGRCPRAHRRRLYGITPLVRHRVVWRDLRSGAVRSD